MKTVYILLFVIIFFGCRNNQNSEAQEKPLFTNLQTIYLETDSSGIPYYQCDTFINHATDSIGIQILKTKYNNILKCEIKPVVNKYDSTIIDTIYYYTWNKNYITIYRAKERDIVFEFNNDDNRISLYNDVRPGITINDFLNRFNIKNLQSNIIQIGDFERNYFFSFFFEKGVLKHITCESYLE
jgi:hypothetical protein